MTLLSVYLTAAAILFGDVARAALALVVLVNEVNAFLAMIAVVAIVVGRRPQGPGGVLVLAGER